MSAAADLGAAALARLAARVGAEPDARLRAEILVLGLADALKVTSNDQNVQRLAREMRAMSADLAVAVASPG